jgi:putative Mn2+ efflux pump MntP
VNPILDVFMREFAELLLVTLALGGDIFSMAMNIGISGPFSKAKQRQFTGMVGLFHVIMPLAGMGVGMYFQSLIGRPSHSFGAFILVVIGLAGIIQTLRHWNMRKGLPDIRVTALAFGVSIDAFTVGLSMGLYFQHIWMGVLLFSLGGMAAAILGLEAGRKAKTVVGKYAELVGGALLVGMGVLLWHMA